MAKKVSTKKPLTGNRRSHALNATKHAQKTNLQKVTINGEKKAVKTEEKKVTKEKEAKSENTDLSKMTVTELKELAKSKKIDVTGLKKAEIIEALEK